MKRILVIDDEADLCELIRSILVSGRYNVDCAYSLAEANRKWGNPPPALVLMDNNLSDGVSLDMLEKNVSLLQDTRIIMMTADPLASTRKRAEKLGIRHFIQKPFSSVKLRELVKRLI